MKILLFSLMMSLVAACNESQKEKPALEQPEQLPSGLSVSFELFQNADSTWGYTILKNNKPMIRQAHIPAIQGEKGFESKRDAGNVADLVTFKVLNDVMPPSVSIAELDSLGVSY